MPLNGTKIAGKINRINSIYHEKSEIAQSHAAPRRTTMNQPNALTPALHDLNVVWFQFFTILNNIDRLTFTARKVQFV